jgi:class 3 adenylate cyclase
MLSAVAPRLRVSDWTLVVALTGVWLVVAALTVGDGLRTQRALLRLGVSSAADAHTYPVIAGVYPGLRSEPLLEAGDALVSVSDASLQGKTNFGFYLPALRAARANGAALVVVERAGERFDARVELTPNPSWWAALPFASALLFTAILLLLRAPGWHLARRNLVACWSFAIITTGMSLGDPPTSLLEMAAASLFPLGAGAAVANCQDFTLSARPVPLAHRCLVALSVVLAFGLVVNYVAFPFSYASISALRMAANVSFAGGMIAALTRAYRRADSLERRQVRCILLGFSVALAAFLAGVGAIVAGVSTWAVRPLVSLSLLAIPAGFFVSVLGYRWLDVDRLISAAASYAIVGFSVLAAALALTPRVASAAAPLLGVEPQTGQWLATLALIGAAIPVHRALYPLIDRRLFAERHARVKGFERLLDEIGRCTSVEELVRLPGERLDELLAPDSIAIYAREERAFTPVFVRGRAAPPAFDADSLLVRTLERRVRPLAADASEIDPFDRAALETLGVSVLVPTRRGDVVAAFSCLGRKRSGDIYTPEELAYLTAVANRCSEALLKLDDQVVLREARELQRALRRYVPGAVADELAVGRDLAPSECEVTVMFIDIRGYSSFAEKRAAEEVFSTVNRYTERVSERVRRHGGSIVEFNGDGMMAVFGAPHALDHKEGAAVEAALEVIQSLGGEIEAGVGIATGQAFVGNISAADRMIWSAIGNTTNLAARLQTLTRELDGAIALDDLTRSRAGVTCSGFERHANVAIRGRSERIDVWLLPLARSR